MRLSEFTHRSFGTNILGRISIKLQLKLSSLRARIWHRIHRLILPMRVPTTALGTTRVRNLGERLGYGQHARLLILHADDFGIAQAVNAAIITGFKTGLINSASVMVPCPWFGEVASFAKANPDADIGLHLTLTSEDATHRWLPAASGAKVPSLVDRQGYLLQEWTSENRISPREVEFELRAQIEKAYAAGLRPTHLDSHQFRLQTGGRDMFELYLGLAREYKLPVLVSAEWLAGHSYLQFALNRRDVVLDRIVTIGAKVAPKHWPTFYGRALEDMPPGVTEFLIHPGFDDLELRELFGDRLPWGAAWRQRDFDFFTSDEFRVLLAKNDIRLVTWRQIASRLSV